jgi:type II secretory pathway component PulC
VSLPIVNRSLAALFLVSAVGLFVNQAFLNASPSEMFLKKANAAGSLPIDSVPTRLFDVNLTTDSFPERNVFQPYRAPEPTPTSAPMMQTSASLGSNFRLSGIYLGENPEALIEAVDEKKTYSVTQGSVLKGLTIKEIRSDAVVITDGQSERTLQ